MYDILELNKKLLPELKEVAKQLNIKRVDALRKQDLIYKIHDQQAILAIESRKVERKPKNVEIYSLKILQYESPFLTFRTVCSKGTYIRSLAYDIGNKLGCGSYLKSLTRTKVGDYSVQDSIFLGDIAKLFNS